MEEISSIVNIVNAVEKVLHVPGNYVAGHILEMTMVLDMNVNGENLKENCIQIVNRLKHHSEIFKNVRLNVVKWKNNSAFENEVVPMPVLLMGKYFCALSQENETKDIGELLGYLKIFHARSKLIIVVTNGKYEISDNKKFADSLNPFLGRKLILFNVKKANNGNEKSSVNSGEN